MIDLTTVLNEDKNLSRSQRNVLRKLNIDPNETFKRDLEKHISNHYQQNPMSTYFKGMWHRPFETSIDDVKQTLKNMHDLGFNHLFVETFFNGRLIFNSLKTDIKTHDFVGDYGSYSHNLLKAFIEEGKNYGIYVHAWVENFFIGQYSDIDQRDEFYQESWLLKNIDGTYLQKNEKNYLFLDPAHIKVRDVLTDIYQEMIDIDGLYSLHLDYIRYPLCHDIDHTSLSDDTGYTDIAMSDFEKIYQIEDMKSKIKEDEKIYNLWKAYKQEKITHFVERIYKIAEFKTKISTAVFGNPDHAINHKMQNWYDWIQKDLVDMIMPMAYYKDGLRVFDEISKMKKLMHQNKIIIAGLAPSFMGLHPLSTIAQIDFAIKAEADGICLFATQNYFVKHFMGETLKNEKYIKLFKECIK